MGGDFPPGLQQEAPDAEFVEVDPSGRYGRYQEVLGRGAFKTVYRAFDEWEGIEVAWNQVKVTDFLRSSDDMERLYAEVNLLKTLNHENIIKFYNSWVDNREGNINFITEIFTSGTLRQYRKKHKQVDIRALKNWSRQILQGLHYLHSHDPPIIHRDLKCDNIFINGNQGEVKIGDLGLATILLQARSAHSVIGTPEFMAPELYEEDYNELVDIYAFGMCLLELVTFEYPYMECSNAAQIYKKVMAGIKPASLKKVSDPEVRAFIEKCIAKVSERLPARDLIMDHFLQPDTKDEITGQSTRPDNNHSDVNGHQSEEASSHLFVDTDSSSIIRDFSVQGLMKDTNPVFLTLRITDATGHPHNIHFPFDIEADTSIGVASEMVTELDLTDHDVSAIAAMIDAEIRSHVHGWAQSVTSQKSCNNDQAVLDKFNSRIKDELFPVKGRRCGGLVLERFPSGRMYWSDSPKGKFEVSSNRSCLSGISEGNQLRDAKNLAEVGKGKASLLNPDGRSHPGCICSPSQSNGFAFSADEGMDNPGMAVLSASSELPCTPIGETVSGEGRGSLLHNSNGYAALISRSGDMHTVNNSEPSVPSCSNHNQISNEEDKKSAFCDNHQFADCQDSLSNDDKTAFESDPEGVKVLVVKLENLLLDQQKELQELKQKHSLAIADLLKSFPPDIQNTVIEHHGL